MKKKKKLGVGIIGLGRIFPRHLNDSIKKIKELELSAVCDVSKQTAAKIGKKEKVPYYTDYKKLICNKDVDIIAVCTPNVFHYEIGMEIAKKGKDCIMEKPIAQDFKQAEKLVKAFKKSKGKLFPVLQVRYNPAVQILKEHVKRGYLGKIFTASLIIRWTRPQEYFSKSNWKGTKKIDGGSLLTQSIHYIDVMQYILGKAKSVFGKADNVLLNIETEDIANAIIDFNCGARANLEFTICTYPHNLECSLAVLGETGTVKLGGIAMNEIEVWEVKNVPRPRVVQGIAPNVYDGGTYVGSCPNHASIYKNMIDVLVYKKKSFIKAEDVLESLRIIDGIKKSSKQKKEVII